MWVCSAINKESKPRSSIAVARAPGAIPSSVTNVEMPNFISSLNHTERKGQQHTSQSVFKPSRYKAIESGLERIFEGR
jgi:hypothetical protein